MEISSKDKNLSFCTSNEIINSLNIDFDNPHDQRLRICMDNGFFNRGYIKSYREKVEISIWLSRNKINASKYINEKDANLFDVIGAKNPIYMHLFTAVHNATNHDKEEISNIIRNMKITEYSENEVLFQTFINKDKIKSEKSEDIFKKVIFSSLQENGPQTLDELANNIDISVPKVNKYLVYLLNDDSVQKTSDNKYKIT